jgi:hypothetical protein
LSTAGDGNGGDSYGLFLCHEYLKISFILRMLRILEI